VVRDSSVLANFIAQSFPNATSVSALQRVQSVAKYRDSKVLANDCPEIVPLRVFEPNAVQTANESATAMQWTSEHGVCAILLRAGRSYRLEGTVALIENPALFFEIEKLAPRLSVAILGRGRASDRLIDWLAEGIHHRVERVIHFPDYDPVGLSEFLRIRAKLGTRIELFSPADLHARFQKFSNPALLLPLKSSALLAGLRQSHNDSVRAVVAMIDEHGGGLEQESLLLSL
jgi:hypothetical protein